MTKVLTILNAIALYEEKIGEIVNAFSNFPILPEENQTPEQAECGKVYHNIFDIMVANFCDNIYNPELDIDVSIEHNADNSVTATIDYGRSLTDGNLNISFMSYHKTFNSNEWEKGLIPFSLFSFEKFSNFVSYVGKFF